MTKRKTQTLNARLRELQPVSDEDFESLAASDEADQLLERITSTPREKRQPIRPRPSRRRREWLTAPRIATGTALAGALAAILALAGLPGSPTGDVGSARGAVHFKTTDGYIIADVRDPFAAQDELDAAFEAHGLDIHLELVPASPSIVGTVVYSSGSGASALETIDDGSCVTGGGACSIGLRIPKDYRGRGEIALGRPARDDEQYLSTADAFAPGEALHCRGLPGQTLGELASVLANRYDSIEWRAGSGDVLPEAPPADHVVRRVHPVTTNSAMVWTQPERPAQQWFDDYVEQLGAGC